MTCFIENSSIVNLDSITIPEKFRNKIEKLLLNNQNLISLPEEISDNFHNLKIYIAEGCKVSKISKRNFVGLNKLISLNLDGNPIEEINDDTFEDLVTLKMLYLSEFWWHLELR